MESKHGSEGILSHEMTAKRDGIVDLLKKAYFMELETVMNYITNSTNPEGVSAQEVKESLEDYIQEELGHAREFANRIKELYGVVPSSAEFEAEQDYLRPSEDPVDVAHVICESAARQSKPRLRR